ncbi:hypothetical protein HTZ84_09690 [Haloterrigena sp. SYSU A558-1]|uniref:Uncharacterized protein n=1 Tax=Haloterrigena gelatinilytica TaxID=2741724 RepID=A0ABX2L8M8_9EURY|nr:hypothetical protein [Haloterrigena gelatinilytica]NUC72577.1 hypothetical protein [Haloterrigena gelatinilytica]
MAAHRNELVGVAVEIAPLDVLLDFLAGAVSLDRRGQVVVGLLDDLEERRAGSRFEQEVEVVLGQFGLGSGLVADLDLVGWWSSVDAPRLFMTYFKL